MASVNLWGPYYYYYAPGIPPRESRQVRYNLYGFRPNPGTITVTAHPHASQRQQYYSVWVSDMSVSRKDTAIGSTLPQEERLLHATLFNSGQPGDGTIYQWETYVSIVYPT